VLSEQYADEKQIDRVEQARANATAVLDPKKLKELLPKHIRETAKAAGSQHGNAALSSITAREAIMKAERIRRMKGSGSIVEGEPLKE
jgi:hypothetical protein